MNENEREQKPQTTLHIAGSVKVVAEESSRERGQEENEKSDSGRCPWWPTKIDWATLAALAAVVVAILQIAMTRWATQDLERAWVMRSDRTDFSRDAPEPDREWEVVLMFDNTGRTPALDVETQATNLKLTGRVVHVPDSSHDWDWLRRATGTPEPTIAQFPSRGIMGPGHKNITHMPMLTLSADEIEQIKRDELGVYIISWIFYRDVWDRSHKTIECSRFLLEPRRLIHCEGDTNRAD